MKVLIRKGTHRNTVAEVMRINTGEGSEPLYALKDRNGKKIWNGQFTYFPTSFVQVLDETVETALPIEAKPYTFNANNWIDGDVTVCLEMDGTFKIYDEVYTIKRTERFEDFTAQFDTWDSSAVEAFVFYTVYQDGEKLFTVHEMGKQDYVANHIVNRSGKNPFIVACMILLNIV